MGVLLLGAGCLIIMDSVIKVYLCLGVIGSSSGGMITSHLTSSSVLYFELELHRYLMVAASC